MPALKVRKKGKGGADGDHRKKKKPPKLGSMHKNQTQYTNTGNKQMVIMSKSGKRMFNVPYAPQEVSHTELGLNWTEIERAARHPALVRANNKLRKMSMTLIVARPDRQKEVETPLHRLARVARSSERIRVKYGKFERGTWRVTAFDINSVRRNRWGRISWAEVTLEFTSTGTSAPYNGPVSGGKGGKKKKKKKVQGFHGQTQGQAQMLIGGFSGSTSGSAGYKKLGDIEMRKARENRNAPAQRRVLKPAKKKDRLKPMQGSTGWVQVGRDRPEWYRWRKGDTLHSVMIKFYGHTRTWKTNELARVNNINNPRKGLKPGSLIRLP